MLKLINITVNLLITYYFLTFYFKFVYNKRALQKKEVIKNEKNLSTKQSQKSEKTWLLR